MVHAIQFFAFALALMMLGGLGCQRGAAVKRSAQGGLKGADRNQSVSDQQAQDQNKAAEISDVLKSQINGASLVDATLYFQLRGQGKDSNTLLCEGQLQGRVKIPDLDQPEIDPLNLLELDDSILECLGFEINLPAVFGLLSNFTDSDDLSASPELGYKVQDGIIWVDRIGESVFAPPRPLFPNFIAADPDTLANLDTASSFEVTEPGQGLGKGQGQLKMLEFGQPFHGVMTDAPWPDTFTFQLSHDGFEEASIPQNLLLDQIAITISRDPLMLTAVQVRSSLWDIVVGGQDKETREGILGQIISFLASSSLAESIAKDVSLVVEVGSFKGLKPGTPKQRNRASKEVLK